MAYFPYISSLALPWYALQAQVWIICKNLNPPISAFKKRVLQTY